MRLKIVSVSLVFAFFPLISTSKAVIPPLSDGRQYEPVVIPLSKFSDWLQTDTRLISQVNVYAFDGQNFQAIPFQIDKKRKVNLRFNNQNPTGPFATDVCEWGYFRERFPPAGSNNPFVSDRFEPNDELVFMLADAGTQSADESQWIGDPNVLTERYVITLKDPRNDAQRWVYVFLWTGTPTDLNSTRYVEYEQDPPAQPSNPCLPGPRACGKVTSFPSNNLNQVDSINVHFKKNWVTDMVTIKSPDSYHLELGNPIKRFEMSTLAENEDTWSSAGLPSFLNTKNGNIRIIRGIQGAQSGFATTKYEFVYPTLLHTRVHLRVHPLQDLNFGVNHNENPPLNNESERYLYQETKSHSSSPSFFDKVDGKDQNPLSDADSFDDWVEFLSNYTGSYIFLVREQRPLTAAGRFFTYSDPGAGVFGLHGRKWQDTGNAQDGLLFDMSGNPVVDPVSGIQLGNDGGCPGDKDPEGSEYLFARLEHFLFPRNQTLVPSQGAGKMPDDIDLNSRSPMLIFGRREIKMIPLPRPNPCNPPFGVNNEGTGLVRVTIGNPCAGPGLGLLVYRGVGGAGPLEFLADIGTRVMFLDQTTRHGVTYQYAVRSYNNDGAISPISPALQILAADTTPPQPPKGVAVSAGSEAAVVSWLPNLERDIKGYHLFLSTSPGGPFDKLTTSPYPASYPNSFTIFGLQPVTYYVKASAVDFAGNESAESPTVSFTVYP